jgi:hypothetical protein
LLLQVLLLLALLFLQDEQLLGLHSKLAKFYHESRLLELPLIQQFLF